MSEHAGSEQTAEGNFEEEYIILTSDAECIDPQVSEEGLELFLEAALTGEPLEQFEDHLLRCEACRADVFNNAAFLAALKHVAL